MVGLHSLQNVSYSGPGPTGLSCIDCIVSCFCFVFPEETLLKYQSGALFFNFLRIFQLYETVFFPILAPITKLAKIRQLWAFGAKIRS